jgi:hypothetical protein
LRESVAQHRGVHATICGLFRECIKGIFDAYTRVPWCLCCRSWQRTCRSAWAAPRPSQPLWAGIHQLSLHGKPTTAHQQPRQRSTFQPPPPISLVQELLLGFCWQCLWYPSTPHACPVGCCTSGLFASAWPRPSYSWPTGSSHQLGRPAGAL